MFFQSPLCLNIRFLIPIIVFHTSVFDPDCVLYMLAVPHVLSLFEMPSWCFIHVCTPIDVSYMFAIPFCVLYMIEIPFIFYTGFVIYPSSCHVIVLLCDVEGGAPLP